MATHVFKLYMTQNVSVHDTETISENIKKNTLSVERSTDDAPNLTGRMISRCNPRVNKLSGP